MNQAVPAPTPPSALRVRRTGHTTSDRYFYSGAALVMLLLTFVGFQPFYLAGEGMGGRQIAPELLPLVVVHGAAMTAWVIVFLVQSLLIATRNRRVHAKLGWLGATIALVVTISGAMVALESVRPAQSFQFWGMSYKQFLIVMLAELMLFTAFVVAGVVSRKRPAIHRPMMLLATLSILAGATVRMPILFTLFGEAGWTGIFGPVFTLGAAFLMAQSALNRGVNRSFAIGLAALILVYLAAAQLASSGAGTHLADVLLGLT